MKPNHSKKSWKATLIQALEFKIERDDRYKAYKDYTCPLCLKAGDYKYIFRENCPECVLPVVLNRLNLGCNVESCMLLIEAARKVGLEKILIAVKRTPREKLTPSYLKRIGIPKQVKPIFNEIKSAVDNQAERNCNGIIK